MHGNEKRSGFGAVTLFAVLHLLCCGIPRSFPEVVHPQWGAGKERGAAHGGVIRNVL